MYEFVSYVAKDASFHFHFKGNTYLFYDVQVKALLRDRLNGKTSGGSSDKTSGGSKEKKTETNESIELNSRNFDELVIKSKDLWIVEFFAPW